MGILMRALGRRIARAFEEAANTPEGQAALERARRRMELTQLVQEVAGTGVADEVACSELRLPLPEDPETVQGAIEYFGGLRTSYLEDRSFRLLTAAATKTPVRPIDPNVSEQFCAEARLGRMSLSDAFAYLVSLEPRLADEPAREAEERRKSPSRRGFRVGDSEPSLVGAWAGSAHPILNTDLARAVVREYSIVTKGGLALDDDPTPFFERKKHSSGGSFALFGRGDTRPRARN
jgi:hypothetical protein